MEILIIIGIIVVIVVIIKIVSAFGENNDLKINLNNCRTNLSETNKKLENLEKEYSELKKREISQNNWLIKQENIRNNLFAEIENNLHERGKAYKWISPLIADVKFVLHEKSRDSSDLIKSKRNT